MIGQSVNQKLELILCRLQTIEVSTARIEENLHEHMRRTESTEEATNELKNALLPVRAHIAQIHGAAKLLGGLAILAGIATAVWRVMLLM